jgi:ankyrin repeat protein
VLKKLIVLLLLSLSLPSFAQMEPNSDDKEQIIPEIDRFFRQISLDDVGGVKKSLLNKDLRPDTLSKYGDSPLPYAVKEDSYKVFKYLTQVPDIDINMENKNTENALMMCAFKGNLELVKYLVEDKGAEIEKDGWSPLHYAATNGHLQIVEYLVNKEADVDIESPNKTTPLMMAARFGHIQVVKYLLDQEADLSLQNDQQLTAIDFAAMNNQREIVDGLKSRWKKLYGNDYIMKPRLSANK